MQVTEAQLASCRNAPLVPILWTDMATRPAATAPAEASATTTEELAIALLASLELNANTKQPCFDLNRMWIMRRGTRYDKRIMNMLWRWIMLGSLYINEIEKS